nr:uncharacterized protein LOC113822015 [Penaeus vannamei]
MWEVNIVRTVLIIMTLAPHTTRAECQAIFEGSLKSCATRCLVPGDGAVPICAAKEDREVKWGVCTVDCSPDYCDDQCRERIVTLDGDSSWIHFLTASASSWMQVVFDFTSSEGAAAASGQESPEMIRGPRRRRRAAFTPFFKGHRLKISRKYYREKFCQDRLKQI